MTSVRGTRGRKDSGEFKFKEIVPSSGWIEDSGSHYLLIQLPGFRKKDVKLQVDSSGTVMVKGERQVNEREFTFFEKTYPVPKDADTENISGKFEDDRFYVIVPKKAQVTGEEKKETENYESRTASAKKEGVEEENEHEKPKTKEENINEDQDDGRGTENGEKSESSDQKACLLESVLKKFKNRKGIVIVAVIAFSLGVFVTHKFE